VTNAAYDPGEEPEALMKASFLLYAVAIVATIAASSSAATARSPARESVFAASGTAKQLPPSAVVPLRVQRLLKKRAPKAAYVPTSLPRGFGYDHYENLGRSGFDLYFRCCDRSGRNPIGFDALNLKPTDSCNQGTAMKVFRIDGVVVAWNSGHNDEEAWHCIRRNRTRVLITVSTSSDWGTPRQLARMVASARPIR
jgi:hypothetical protein